MNLTFTHLKLLIQLHDSPLLASSLNGHRILALQDMEKQGLVNHNEGRAFITTKGLDSITHLLHQLNDYVSAV